MEAEPEPVSAPASAAALVDEGDTALDDDGASDELDWRCSRISRTTTRRKRNPSRCPRPLRPQRSSTKATPALDDDGATELDALLAGFEDDVDEAEANSSWRPGACPLQRSSTKWTTPR
ncbi:MAG: hypothetical protein R3F34_12205 [Planctomycetota bacterium]